MRRIRVTGPARRDIIRILRHSSAEFGNQARQRYRKLIDQALEDLGDNAIRFGVQPINDIRKGYFLNHLKWSRNSPAGQPVRQPRHLFAFSIDTSDDIIVARMFHERQMLSRHLGEPENH